MILVLCAFVMAAALLSAFAFGGDLALSLIAAGAAVGLAVFDLLLGRRKGWLRALTAVLCFGLLGFCFYIPSRATEYGYYDYLDKSAGYLAALQVGDTEDAELRRAEIVEQYGENDELRFLTAVTAMSYGDLNQVDRILWTFEDRTTMDYYLLKEELIVNSVENPEERTRQLRQLFVEAAENNPAWVYALENAGGLLFDAGEYERAAYYLVNALACADAPNAETLYFLGASMMEQGAYDQGLYYFQLALDNGADQEIVNSIAWYAEKAGIEVKRG